MGMAPRARYHIKALFVLATWLCVAAQTSPQQDCFTDPSAASCEDFTVPAADLESDLAELCVTRGWPAACTLFAECQANRGLEEYCQPLRLLRTACAEQPDAAPCQRYVTLCDAAKASVVKQCSENTALDNLPTAESSMEAVISMCNAMPEMDGCDACTTQSPPGQAMAQALQVQCPDPFGSLARVCTGMWMTGCELWDEFCVGASNNDAFPALCGGQDAPSATSPTSANSSPSLSSSSSSCYEDPAQPSCRDFMMPDEEATADLTALCESMPNMVGCSLWTQCKSGGATGVHCKPFSLVGTICVDMPSMSGCSRYLQLCAGEESAVKQCTSQPPVPDAPTTDGATSDVLAMCGDHSMPSCSECPSRLQCPHPLDTLAALCLGMPGMARCSGFYAMCQQDGGDTFGKLCGDAASGSGDANLPPMRMWIHSGIRDILLFKEWVPETPAAYAGACIGVLLAAFLVQFLKAVRLLTEARWARELREPCCGGEGRECCGGAGVARVAKDGSESSLSELQELEAPTAVHSSRRVGRRLHTALEHLPPRAFVPGKAQLWRNFVRSVFTFVVVLLDYALMLIVMSFNLGIIFSTVAGFALGALIFGHAGERRGVAPVNDVTADPENELEVQFVDSQPCCSATVRHV